MKLPYVVEGDGSGPMLVFAHGLMGTGTAQRLQLAPLVAAGWTVATFDQRGHGAAPPMIDAAGYDPGPMGDDLWKVADDAGFERCWIGGGSMGAATSFCAARSNPKRVQGFIQAVPALRDEPHPLIFLFDALADRVRDEGTSGLAALLRQLADDMGREEQDEIFLEQILTHDAVSIECALRSVPRWILPDVPSAFATFTFPTIVIGWDDDPIHPLQTAKDVATAAGVDVIEANQAVVLGDRELFGKLLLEALDGVAA